MGIAIETMIKSYAWKYVKAEIIRRTIFAGLMVALWPAGLLKFAQVLDNPWKIASTRALKVIYQSCDESSELYLTGVPPFTGR